MLSNKQLLQSKQMTQVIIITTQLKNNQNTSLINIQDTSPPLMM